MSEVTVGPGDPRRQNPTASIPPTGRAPIGKVGGYLVHERIGRGGMGVVYRATQLTTKRPVALKLISPGLVDDEKVLLRFDREVELAARLEHPNIARVYDSGKEEGTCFYAMELIRGRDLAAFCEAKSLDDPAIVDLTIVVCRAVQFAHQRGIIHRDLKPGNVLVGEDERPKVTDFGLARLLGGSRDESQRGVTIEGSPAGTPGFMAPEQARGDFQIDTRSDVFSLGAMLFALLTRESAYDLTGSQFEVLQRIATGEPRRPRTLRADLDSELDAIITKAMAVAPEERYGSAGELADDLARYRNGEMVLARPHTTRYLLGKQLRKHRGKVLVAAAVMAMAVGGAAYADYLVVRQRNTALAARDRAVTAELNAQAARQRAAQNLDVATDAIDQFLSAMGTHTLAGIAGMRPLRVDLESRAEEFYRHLLANDPNSEPLRYRLAYELQNESKLSAEAQDYKGAVVQLSRSAALAPPADTPARWQQLLAKDYAFEVVDGIRGGDLAAAENAHAKLNNIYETLDDADRKSDAIASAMSESGAVLNKALRDQGQTGEAVKTFKSQINGLEQQYAANPGNGGAMLALTDMLIQLEALYCDLGDLPNLQATQARVISVRRDFAASSPGSYLALSYYSEAYQKYADFLRVSNQRSQARVQAQAAIDLANQCLAIRPDDANGRLSVTRAHSTLGRVEVEDGNPAEALKHYQIALSSIDSLPKDEPGFGEAQYSLAYQMALTAEPLALLGRFDEAQASYEKASTAASAAEPDEESSRRSRQLYSRLAIAHAVIEQCMGRPAESQYAVGQARHLLEEVGVASMKVRHDLAYLDAIPSMSASVPAALASVRSVSAGAVDAAVPAAMNLRPTTAPTNMAAFPAHVPPVTQGVAVAAGPAPQVGTVEASDTATINERNGEMAVVHGTVDLVKTTGSGIVFIHFAGTDSHSVEGVILPRDAGQVRSDLGGDPDALFRGKAINLSGQITTYHGRPEVLIHNAKQLQIAQ